MTTPAEGLITLDDTLATARDKVEVLFPSIAEVPLPTNVDEITTPTEELCTLDDTLKTD